MEGEARSFISHREREDIAMFAHRATMLLADFARHDHDFHALQTPLWESMSSSAELANFAIERYLQLTQPSKSTTITDGNDTGAISRMLEEISSKQRELEETQYDMWQHAGDMSEKLTHFCQHIIRDAYDTQQALMAVSQQAEAMVARLKEYLQSQSDMSIHHPYEISHPHCQAMIDTLQPLILHFDTPMETLPTQQQPMRRLWEECSATVTYLGDFVATVDKRWREATISESWPDRATTAWSMFITMRYPHSVAERYFSQFGEERLAWCQNAAEQMLDIAKDWEETMPLISRPKSTIQDGRLKGLLANRDNELKQ